MSAPGNWISEAWRKDHLEEIADEQDDLPKRIARVAEREENSVTLVLIVLCVFGSLAHYLNTLGCRSLE